MEQAKLKEADKALDQKVLEQSRRVGTLEEQVKKLTRGEAGVVVNSGAGPTASSRFRPEYFFVDRLIKFEERQEFGLDYAHAIAWQKSAAENLPAESNHLKDVLLTATIEVPWAGTATLFKVWPREEHRDRLLELVSALASRLGQAPFHIKGRIAGRLAAQVPPTVKKRQEASGVALDGLKEVLKTVDDKDWRCNVFFGGPFSIFVGKIPVGGKEGDRPVREQHYFGKVSEAGVLEWKDDELQKMFKVSGAEVERLGHEARAANRRG